MAMPRLGPEHERLERLAGSWQGEEDVSGGPWGPGGPAVARYRFSMALDGFFLLADYEQERDGIVIYRGHGVFGWDQDQGVNTMHWFDNVSPAPGSPAHGGWDGDTLTFEHETGMGHSRYQFTLAGPDRLEVRIEMSADGLEWRPFVTGVLSRRDWERRDR